MILTTKNIINYDNNKNNILFRMAESYYYMCWVKYYNNNISEWLNRLIENDGLRYNWKIALRFFSTQTKSTESIIMINNILLIYNSDITYHNYTNNNNNNSEKIMKRVVRNNNSGTVQIDNSRNPNLSVKGIFNPVSEKGHRRSGDGRLTTRQDLLRVTDRRTLRRHGGVGHVANRQIERFSRHSIQKQCLNNN